MAESDEKKPDGIDLNSQISHQQEIYDGDCATFGEKSMWAIKSGSVLASLMELRDRRTPPPSRAEAEVRAWATHRFDNLAWRVFIGEICIASWVGGSATHDGGQHLVKPEVAAKQLAAKINAEVAGGVVAFGCDSEAKNKQPCTNWCGSENCPVTTAAIRSLTAHPSDAVTVPREPTEAMLKAGAEMYGNCLHSAAGFDHHAGHVYCAMLDAAPNGGKGE